MHPQRGSKQQQNNKLALVFMLGAVVLYSAKPLSFSIGKSGNAPFLFVALLFFFATISSLCYLLWMHRTQRKHQSTRETLKIIYKKTFSKAFPLLLLSRFQHLFFALSLSHINVALASILLSTWPFFMVIITTFLFKKDNRYQKIAMEKWLLFALAFIGVGFVVVSQSETFGALARDLFNQSAIIGIAFALIAALSSAASASFSLKLGSDASKESGGGKSDELFFSTALLVVAWVLSCVTFIILGLLSGESVSDINLIPAGFYGFFGIGLGAILWRLANIKTDNLGINAIGYSIPVLGLIWLALAGLLDVSHFDWLIIGTTAIIIANLLLNFKTNIRPTHKVLIIVLWLSAMLTYLISA